MLFIIIGIIVVAVVSYMAANFKPGCDFDCYHCPFPDCILERDERDHRRD